MILPEKSPREDPTCCGASEPVRDNYWASAPEPGSQNCWARVPQLLQTTRPRACALQQAEPLQREAGTPQPEEQPPLATTREKPTLQQKTQYGHK